MTGANEFTRGLPVPGDDFPDDFPDQYWRRPAHRIPLDVRADIGAFLHAAGVHPMVSTFIDDETITHGYGELDGYGDWEFPVFALDYRFQRDKAGL
jgi:hypothetical protein